MTLLIVCAYGADRRLHAAEHEDDEQQARCCLAQAHSHSTTLERPGSSNRRGSSESEHTCRPSNAQTQSELFALLKQSI